MKKLLVILLALVLVLSLVACDKEGSNGDNENENPNGGNEIEDPNGGNENEDPNGGNENEDPNAGPVEGEELPATPLYYNGFESVTDDLLAVHRGTNVATDAPELTGATYALIPSAHDIVISDGYGAVGNSLVLDGKYGVRIQDFPGTADDTYTVSFWYAADRYSQYGAIVAMGRNVGMNDTENQVTWLSFTKADTWSVEAGEAAPVIWNRNSMPSDGSAAVWPWIGNNAGLRGKKEWVHVTLVVDGQTYKTDDGCSHVGATVYVDGVPVMTATPANTADSWMGIAPEILTGDGVYGVEALIGINYWDALYKGYIDELYVYDEALTAGQVATLYGLGTAPEYQNVPAYDGPVDDEGEPTEPTEPTLPEITPDASALDTIGTTARDNGFWTDNSDSFELTDGGTLTIKFNNYSAAGNVYENPVFAFTNVAVTTDKVAGAADFPGYAEYGVVRVDGITGAFWVDGCTATFEKSWPDDATFMEVMKDAEVTAVFTRTGNAVTIDLTIVGADGTTLTEKIEVTLGGMATDAACYFHITNEKDYIEILSVE